MDLTKKHCIPCEGTEKPFNREQIDNFTPGLSKKWDIVENKKIRHEFTFKNFPDAITFVNSIVPIAEGEGHHPDIHVYYNKVLIELWTHAIRGLSENDFIMAAKIETLV